MSSPTQLKRHPHIRSRSKHNSIPFRSPVQNHLGSIPEESKECPRDITPSSIAAPVSFAIESCHSDDYLCRTPPRPAPLPPCPTDSHTAFDWEDGLLNPMAFISPPMSPIDENLSSSPSSSYSSPSAYSQRSLPSTPCTSDDDQAASPLPPTCPLLIRKHEPNPEDASFYASELASFIRFTSPTPPSPSTLTSKPRPDSVLPIPSTGTPGGPSSQLDPMYPKKLRRSAVIIPSYPPPPPPNAPPVPSFLFPPTPSSAPSFLSIDRPPPRSPVPTDLGEEGENEDGEEFQVVWLEADRGAEDEHAVYPAFVLPSPITPDHTGDFEAQVWDELDHHHETVERNFPSSPCPSSDDTHDSSHEPQHTLRSKFSTSTLGSIREKKSSKWKGAKLKLPHLKRTSLGGFRSPMTPAVAPIVPITPSLSTPHFVKSPKKKAHYYYHASTPSSHHHHPFAPKRSNSTSSSSSYAFSFVSGSGSSSSDSTSVYSAASESSNGLRRKPIPVEMFLRA